MEIFQKHILSKRRNTQKSAYSIITFIVNSEQEKLNCSKRKSGKHLT